MLKHKFGKIRPFMAPEGTGGGEGAGDTGSSGAQTGSNPNQQTQQAPAFDYEKLASIITGKQSVTEDTVLKSYFKHQGLSQEEMKQAIDAFKAEKAKNQPDPNALQVQAQQAQAAALRAEMEKESLLMAGEIGVDLKTIPYLMKMADVKDVIVEGKVDKEKLKEAINKVLEDVPQLKAQTETNGGNGFKFGASGSGGNNTATDDQLKAAFGL
ncbi:hypothetical protein D1155_07940 [Anaerotruncus sp. 80]|uniref:DUF4355 domain-containing protein n=1 Tax=Anaerotruncus colihominis TaxID=169435 RepID=A0A845QLK3_9FIRM|nr:MULTISPECIES: hypothetical protein [Anaerotruncus]NBH61577.1 hypothetical protein [Anaerotruncus colihominis]NCF02232.1 hypothetical protein [Anaerotruncus sp. 80]